jgi:hypothetical protein
LPKALVIKWIAYIRLFNFIVCYVLRTKHTTADGLSQRPCTKLDNIDKANKVNINNFINTKLNAFSIAPVTTREAKVDLLINKYSEDS